MDNKEAFLKELADLSKKYDMYIGGCGCCSSPFIDNKEGKELFGDLSWDDERKEYTVS